MVPHPQNKKAFDDQKDAKFISPVGVDETYMGGKYHNMHKSKKPRMVEAGVRGKTPVVVIKERGSKKVKVKVTEPVSSTTEIMPAPGCRPQHKEKVVKPSLSFDQTIFATTSDLWKTWFDHETRGDVPEKYNNYKELCKRVSQKFYFDPSEVDQEIRQRKLMRLGE